MKKGRIFSVIIVIVLITISFTGCFSDDDKDQNDSEFPTKKYTKIINRNFKNHTEELILNYTESFEYTTVINFSQYRGDPILDETEYVWLHYIDSSSLDYYKKRINYLEENNIKVSAYLNYTANIYQNNSISIEKSKRNIYYNNSPDEVLVHSDIIYFDFIDLFYNENNSFSSIEIDLDNEFKYTFENSYLIEMIFLYGETYGAVSGFSTTVYQYIVVDHDFKLQYVSIFNGGYEIS